MAAGVNRVRGVRFAALGEGEVRELAVCRVVSPAAFDAGGRVVPGGLYDSRMGPLDKAAGKCRTCQLMFQHCPGHLGYLEFAMVSRRRPGGGSSPSAPPASPPRSPEADRPADAPRRGPSQPFFNPLLINHAHVALRAVCHSCHRLKCTDQQKAGLLHRAGPRGGGADGAPPEPRVGEEAEAAAAGLGGGGARPAFVKGTQHWEAMAGHRWQEVPFREALGFLKRVAQERKCPHCEATNEPLVLDKASRMLTGGQGQKYFSPVIARHILRQAWARDPRTFRSLFAGFDLRNAASSLALVPGGGGGSTFTRTMKLYSKWVGDVGPDRFFVTALPVPANRFRPVQHVNGNTVQHPTTVMLAQLLKTNLELREVVGTGTFDPEQADANDDRFEHSVRLLSDLQQNFHKLLAGEADTGGLRNVLDKKEGLFRMSMQGKRINYAGRSVIAPDPFIRPSQLGIPRNFAKKLTFPEVLNDFNKGALADAVRNGPDRYPGAVNVQDQRMGMKSLVVRAKQREAAANTLRSKPTGVVQSGSVPRNIAIHRHIRDGDTVLINRQPTLHRPSIMAHRVRVLPAERTIRLHYTNCKTLNADFDGDELNIHVPQDVPAQAEAGDLMDADAQFILPTDGKPVRGLIQDHVVGGCKLSLLDAFLTREEYTQLVCVACASALDLPADDGALHATRSRAPPLLPPAILKPRPLWTGKQVFSSLLLYLIGDRERFSMEGKTKLSPAALGPDTLEHRIHVRDGELLTGVLDKGIFGDRGLVHAFQELYGDRLAGYLLGALSHLLSAVLRRTGFTVGLDDFVLVAGAEADRVACLARAEQAAEDATFLLIQERLRLREAPAGPQPGGGESHAARTRRLVEALVTHVGDASAQHDAKCMSALNQVSSDTIDQCLARAEKPFPRNNLAMMTNTGAKGSTVNSSQISVLLGQQALEGRRVPLMQSLKTLPCFAPCDIAPRAHGYIADRYLSGLRPQEFYFHCMAGRDGLVDTTVKTARSGYMQRCLIKNLEALHVAYDGTVRGAGNDVVQFRYGDDGLDATKRSYLQEFDFLARNSLRVAARLQFAPGPPGPGSGGGAAASGGGAPPPLPDAVEAQLEAHVAADAGRVFTGARAAPGGAKKRKTRDGARAVGAFKDLLRTKYAAAQVAPGENVGVVAGQSIGEPSTQMTLNTFHFAGRADANVTMGIPRLVELFMSNASTGERAAMYVPLRADRPSEEAARIPGELQELYLGEVLKALEVVERPFRRGEECFAKCYFEVRVTLFPIEMDEAQLKHGIRRFAEHLGAYLKKSAGEWAQRHPGGGEGAKGAGALAVDFEAEPPAVKVGRDGVAFALPFAVDAQVRKYLLMEAVAKAATGFSLHETHGIAKATLTVRPGQKPLVTASGTNVHQLYAWADHLALDELQISDIRTVLEHYGVEAARAAIVLEVQKVFDAYGVGVDPRHLELVADFMTRTGGYTACNRMGIDHEPSPLMRMSFETATAFLSKAALVGDVDFLTGPSAMICLGQPARSGTGFVGLYQRLGE